MPDFWRHVGLDMGAFPMVIPTDVLPAAPFTPADFNDSDAMLFIKSAEYMYTQRGADELTVTASLLDTFFAGVTLKVPKPASPFRLFDPFATDLWLANLSCFFGAAILLIIFNAIAPSKEFAEYPLKDRVNSESVGLSFYHMISMLLSGEDYEFATAPQRILRVGLLFVVLVTSASYTANLAAFFTAPSFSALGPTDTESLSTSRACTTWNLDLKAIEPFVANVTALSEAAPESGIVWSIFDRQDFCLEKLKKREVDVWLVGELEARRALQARGCTDLALQENIAVATVSIGLALPSQNADLARNISASIVHLKNSPAGARLMAQHFNVGTSICSKKEISETTQLSLESQRGLFYIFMVIAGIALLVAGVQAMLRWADVSMSGDGSFHHLRKIEHTMTDGEMLRMLLKKMDSFQAVDKPAKSNDQPAQGLDKLHTQAWEENDKNLHRIVPLDETSQD